MGVGKTATAIRGLDMLGYKRGIIVVPAFLRRNWIKEFEKFAHVPRSIVRGETVHDFAAWQRGRFDTLVTSYEQAVNWKPHIDQQAEFLDFVLFDEAHKLKNPDIPRTKALLGPEADGVGGLPMWARVAWHITGTPMINDPLDIFTFLKMCGAMPLRKTEFIKRYFHVRRTTYGSRQMPRPEMVEELTRLINANSIRRTLRETGVELPPIFLSSMFIDGDASKVNQFLAEHPGLDRSIIATLQEQGNLSFLDSQYVSTLRRLIGEAKVPSYCEMVREELEGGLDKIAIYGIHQHALKMIQDYFARKRIKMVLVNGTTTKAMDEEAERAFNNDPECRGFIANIEKAGAGVNLQVSAALDIFESDWSPGKNAQAVKRVHRIGQRRNVRGRFITLAGSFDEMVNKIVAEKTAAIAQIEGEAMAAAPSDVLDQIRHLL
jgi:SNF2 family DNA or RNA helicase